MVKRQRHGLRLFFDFHSEEAVGRGDTTALLLLLMIEFVK